ncbi:hypothetical protein AK830_g9358 [Neonectria ditissima]|uniref:Uncharacterized protein n=1 Tax=Neonectria ditissima TaxID=78410 RepID=A0A0N8H5V1_9HYPO|nr:hypothetical protein AK830_g9358 [Neonectria ditissima]
MEAAAKTVQLLTQRILPEKPHHLSYSPDWQYRIPVNDAKSKRFEEWDNTRLQYATLLSEADRGVLLTRSYYDMRVEPPKPIPREVNTLAKAGNEKKKLSLSDYKNKKTSGATSDTTPEPPNARKRDADRAHGDLKPPPEMRKPDSHRIREGPHVVDPKPPKPRENIVDMRYGTPAMHKAQEPPKLTSSRLPPKPPTKAPLPPRPVSPDSRKRMADVDDDHRSQKRARPDLGRAFDDRPRASRDEPPRRKDRDSLAPSDYPSQRDTKSSSSSLPNGRSILKGSAAGSRNLSPAGRARGDSLNGARHSALGSAKNTPTKADSSSRPSVPPLLSPLHLNLDGREGADRGERRRAREDAVDGTRPTKLKKQEEPPVRVKRERSPVRLPALLSPTLPPQLEAELSKRVKQDAKLDPKLRDDRDKEERVERRSEERLKEDRASSTTARKAPVEQDDDDSGGKDKRKRLIVTLYISKRIRQSVKRYLALPPRKEPSLQERSISSEAPPAQAKKRPVSTTETIVDSISVKRPRTSSISGSSRLPPPPSTPSKKGTTAMSRVSSNNSQVNTPGDAATATPSAPASSDRPVTNGTDGPRTDKVEYRAMMAKQAHFNNLGRRLKHKGDQAMNRSAQANGSMQQREMKLGHVYTVESIIAFMTSFQALNISRSLSGKAYDAASWTSLFPLLEFLQKEVRRLDMQRYRPLYALILMLHAVSIEETIKAYSTFDNPSPHITVNDLVKHERNRARIWPLVGEANDAIESPSLRVSSMPWSTLDEISTSALQILRHWCADENVEWTPEVNLRDTGGDNGSRGHA